jgi:hypothetical protein
MFLTYNNVEGGYQIPNDTGNSGVLNAPQQHIHKLKYTNYSRVIQEYKQKRIAQY